MWWFNFNSLTFLVIRSQISFFRNRVSSIGSNYSRTRFVMDGDGWSTLPVCKEEVEIATVLACGQSFRWKPMESEPDCWIGVFANRVWILKQIDSEIHFKVHTKDNHHRKKDVSSEESQRLLHKYFQLDISLKSLYKEWSSKDERFANLTTQDYRGIRMLNQDCVENVFSFICSSNNNIARISQMVEKLCVYYGDKITTIDGKDYYDFPNVEKLVGEKVEKKLREEKFGYRAGFIAKTASVIRDNGGASWLESLKGVGYEEARKELQTLPGIGRKVADCICLMSLGYQQAIPVDTHMHQIAIQYLPHLSKLKTLTDKAYSEITDYFRALHGEYAGWAHSVLFSSTLKHLQVKEKKPKASVSKRKSNQDTPDTDPCKESNTANGTVRNKQTGRKRQRT